MPNDAGNYVIIIIIINEYYCSSVESEELQEHLTTEKKIKPTTVSHRIRTGFRDQAEEFG